MPPVMKIAIGFAVVFGAFRLNGFDLLFDPVGWSLCASGLFQLERSADDPFGRARPAAIAMAAASCLSLVTSDAVPDRSPMSAPIQHGIGIACTVGALVTVWLSVDAVIRRIRTYGDVSRADLLDVLRWAVVGPGALALPAGYGYADPGVVPLTVWFAAVGALVTMLYRSARLLCLSSAWEPPASQA
ncbi:hypothetical protein [Planomonospora parontospora]|uniref:hypothetical protein n=1 Tax=Planomonospora parontospora TaxID=58119 RepID=UPI0016702807|nr:hypothetical protein [Planomonospora parontospora]GGL30384.1 hypothetical protein GCM10014719_34670 [Planomonospora parontospora subsp. antibiotica]GII17713.1 hypothetical protein Ppa05_44390 [Planomonospora parontospora subsp. antibiotica]